MPGGRLWVTAPNPGNSGNQHRLFYKEPGDSDFVRLNPGHDYVFTQSQVINAVAQLGISINGGEADNFRPRGMVGVGDHLYFALKFQVGSGQYDAYIFRMDATTGPNMASSGSLTAVARINASTHKQFWSRGD